MRYFLILACFLLSSLSEAYWIHGVTGDLMPYGQNKVLGAVQLIRSPVGTIGVFGNIERRIHDSGQLVGTLSLGGNLEVGAFYKWVPVPDYKKQPAIGVLAGASYGRVKKATTGTLTSSTSYKPFTLKSQTFMSKRFRSTYGTFNSYIALPVGIEFGDNETKFPIKLAIGTEVSFPSDEKKVFLIELGVNLNDSSTSALIGMNFYF